MRNPTRRRAVANLSRWPAMAFSTIRSSPRLLGFVLVEPARDIQHFGDVMARTTSDSVRFFRYAHQNRVDIEQLQSRIELLGLRDGSAKILLSGHHQRRRFNLGDQ